MEGALKDVERAFEIFKSRYYEIVNSSIAVSTITLEALMTFADTL
jgi:hypothetical protein